MADYLWIISGQSNAVGAAVGSGPTPVNNVKMWNGAGWQPAQDPMTFTDHTGCEGPVSAWVTAAHAFSFWVPGSNIFLSGYAKPSMPISSWAEGGAMWLQLRANILAANKALNVFIWYQGETDAVQNTLLTEYQAALIDVISRVRALVNNPTLPVVIVGLGEGPADYAAGYWSIREAQKSVAERTGALYVSAERLPLDAPLSPYHLSAAGYAALGKRIAAYLAGVM